MKRTSLIIILFLFLMIMAGTSGCSCGNGSVISKTGTVKYVDLNGWFYGIVSDDESEYEVANLAPTYQEDGLRVRFDARILGNTGSVHQWGTMVELTDIELIEGG